MSDTSIEWAEKVWNPVTGCTKASKGCRNCYAERMSKRLAGRAGYPEDGFKVTLHPDKLDEPLRWKKPARVFVCSMGDLFHKDVSDEWIDSILCLMLRAQQHIFLLLTKRPERMAAYFNDIRNNTGGAFARLFTQYSYASVHGYMLALRRGEAFPNLYLGVSIEDQKTADERIPILLQVPAAKRFVSYEPALGPVDFTNIAVPSSFIEERHERLHNFVESFKFNSLTTIDENHYYNAPSKLDWIIMGGESGPGARPMHPDWARSVRDQCAAAGVPFFLKQLGEWEPDGEVPFKDPKEAGKVIPMYIVWSSSGPQEHGKLGCYHIYDENGQGTRFKRVGKKAAGCLLDGKEHKERP